MYGKTQQKNLQLRYMMQKTSFTQTSTKILGIVAGVSQLKYNSPIFVQCMNWSCSFGVCPLLRYLG